MQAGLIAMARCHRQTPPDTRSPRPQPGAYLPGRTTAGTVTGTNSVAGTVFGGVTGNVIQGIKVYSNGVSINNNFGELQAATLSGYVFIDTNSNAAPRRH